MSAPDHARGNARLGRGLILRELDGRRYAQFERLAQMPGLVHAFATRPQDVSARMDERATQRAARRAQMAGDLGFDPARLVYCEQVHESRLLVVDEKAAPGVKAGIDGLATNQANLPLMTFSADCPLILVFDPRRRVLGMAHASWRCTVARLTASLVRLLQERFDCRPADLLAGIGPSAGPCCYEVKDDVYAAAAGLPGLSTRSRGRLRSTLSTMPEGSCAADSVDSRESLFIRRDGRMYFDLWAANRAQLLESGVPEAQIETAGVCTMCRTDLFFSFRREGPGCGHFGLMAGLSR